MPRSQTSAGIVRAGLATLAVVAALAGSSAAFAQSAEDIAAGRQLFLQKGNCQACHGWAADGRKMDSQMPDGAEPAGDPARTARF
jgi:mono/diheme cytochrome c family protein